MSTTNNPSGRLAGLVLRAKSRQARSRTARLRLALACRLQRLKQGGRDA